MWFECQIVGYQNIAGIAWIIGPGHCLHVSFVRKQLYVVLAHLRKPVCGCCVLLVKSFVRLRPGVARSPGQHTGPAQGSHLCAQVEPERELHPECRRGQGEFATEALATFHKLKRVETGPVCGVGSKGDNTLVPLMPQIKLQVLSDCLEKWNSQ